jgi:hypothetical protein
MVHSNIRKHLLGGTAPAAHSVARGGILAKLGRRIGRMEIYARAAIDSGGEESGSSEERRGRL